MIKGYDEEEYITTTARENHSWLQDGFRMKLWKVASEPESRTFKSKDSRSRSRYRT